MKSDEPLQWFVAVFNSGFPTWERDGDADKELMVEDVEYSYTTSCWAKCGPRPGENEIYFACNKEWWQEHNTEERIMLLIHEIAHYKHPDHSPAFHLTVGNCYNRIERNLDSLEDKIGEKVDFEEVARLLVNDIGQHQVDKRMETVYEARKKLADRIDYEISEKEALDGIDVTKKLKSSKRRYKSVPVEDIDCETLEISEICEWLRSPRKEYISKGDRSHSYIVDPIEVEQDSGESFVPKNEHGVFVASLLRHVGENNITVKL